MDSSKLMNEIWSTAMNNLNSKRRLDVSKINSVDDVKKILEVLKIEATTGYIEQHGLEMYFK